MNVKKNILFFMMSGLCVLAQPFSVFADKCDDVANKASAIFDQAKNAADQQDFAEAADLYEKAERYYKNASKMKNCNCPTLQSTAITSVEICRKNAEKSRQASSEYGEVKVYNQATILFNEGNIQARNQQWSEAVSSFEQAEVIWRDIDTSSPLGQKAQQAANEASKLANLARQQI